jgi:hypothetical protein
MVKEEFMQEKKKWCSIVVQGEKRAKFWKIRSLGGKWGADSTVLWYGRIVVTDTVGGLVVEGFGSP